MSNEEQYDDEVLMIERLCGHVSEIRFQVGMTDDEKREVIRNEIKTSVCEHCEKKKGEA